MPVPHWVTTLPAIDATLNSLATLLLIVGYYLIKQNRTVAHRRTMLCAFTVSVLFLMIYLTHHFALYHYTGSGSQKFPTENSLRPYYLIILLTHILLAAVVPVLAIITIWRAYKQQWEQHRKIAKITFPIWLYVSVTGVIIYVMLYHMA